MLLRKRFLLHRRVLSRKKKVVVLHSCFLQLLGEKKGGAVKNRWGEGRGKELKEYSLPFYQLCQEGEFAGF